MDHEIYNQRMKTSFIPLIVLTIGLMVACREPAPTWTPPQLSESEAIDIVKRTLKNRQLAPLSPALAAQLAQNPDPSANCLDWLTGKTPYSLNEEVGPPTARLLNSEDQKNFGREIPGAWRVTWLFKFRLFPEIPVEEYRWVVFPTSKIATLERDNRGTMGKMFYETYYECP